MSYLFYMVLFFVFVTFHFYFYFVFRPRAQGPNLGPKFRPNSNFLQAQQKQLPTQAQAQQCRQEFGPKEQATGPMKTRSCPGPRQQPLMRPTFIKAGQTAVCFLLRMASQAKPSCMFPTYMHQLISIHYFSRPVFLIGLCCQLP